MASSSSSSSSTQKYEVFLNFRGSDTRKNFTGHLYHALVSGGVDTFFDDEELLVGDVIGSALVTAIKESRIAIPVFSKDYAASKWCLNELTVILQCYEMNNQIVLPIFLDVKPSEVRNQTGSFGEAFLKHMNVEPTTVGKWREALKEVGKLKGLVLEEFENGNEAKLIQLVVKMVLNELSKVALDVARYPIGLDSRVEDLLSLLSVDSTYRKVVGVYGMGGIGKTTIVRAVYNKIFRNFEGSSFLANIRERSSEDMDLVSLQTQLLSDILGKDNYPVISHVREGVTQIKQRLKDEKVLLILDDVDHRKQLYALMPDLNWFGPGSRIIITTRDELVLTMGQVNDCYIYRPRVLDDDQSLELLSMHAFTRNQPPDDYLPLSRKVVSYAGGLPLTLAVLGSILCDMKGKEEWESILLKLKEGPLDEVFCKLKISYNGLDDLQKAMFLDIACFFIGMNKDLAMDIWEACHFFPLDLNVLILKCLVWIDDNDELTMHDQLRDMGRKIVYDESPKEPGKRSRLWSRKEIMEVLKGHKETPKVEAIKLENGDCFSIEDFARMSNLRLLQVSGGDLEGNIEHLPSRLRCLYWKHCPLEILPSSFCLEKLVILDLSFSKIRQAWNNGLQTKRFKNLKVLNLSHCLHLAESPNFSGFPRLKRLILVACERLVDLHESIGKLKNLVLLDLAGCIKFKKLPESIGGLESLVELKLDGTQIGELPNSIGMLLTMRCLPLRQCCSFIRVPDSIGRIISLVLIYLDNTSIVRIPDSIGLLENLQVLSVKGCRNLKSFQMLPSSLVILDASECISLERLPDISNLKKLLTIHLVNCTWERNP